MTMLKIKSSGNDEFYTPPYAITPIVKYIKDRGYKKIWCPFDTEHSQFVHVFGSNGFEVVNTHISSGSDFFLTETPECDCIISNPPYSIKGRVFECLFERKKPFAMLVGITGMFDNRKRFSMFSKNDFEILYLSKRIAYFKSFEDQVPAGSPPFQSVYICHKFLPKQICFAEIVK